MLPDIQMYIVEPSF